MKKNLIRRVKTDQGILRYDAILKPHHHLYCAESDRIEDYYNDRLNKLLEGYFSKNKIPNFNIENIRLHISGRFRRK